ncbi:OmpA family protein [Sphingomonas sp. LY29]|uniref:OmpA family protein n=1 Tax=Sphingomonas sp. LY29 TaxID=3095341 RepID=UPI002D78275B|nr:OmpA family protein [Sphingomonas sp. LY29]WRP26701.1 OmpA family protein [Sphingomonas sp. LY29]
MKISLYLLAAWGVAAIAPAAATQQPVRPVPGVTMVFFGWDRPDVDRDGAASLDDAASAYLQSPGAVISIEGHSDRSGPSGANLEASRRRAETVRTYLAGRGVPMASMRVSAYGEQRPLIATADGVREPQNRRVDVRINASAN